MSTNKRKDGTLDSGTSKKPKPNPAPESVMEEGKEKGPKQKKWTPNIASADARGGTLCRGDDLWLEATKRVPISCKLNKDAHAFIPAPENFQAHNKSGLPGLSLLAFSDSHLERTYRGMTTTTVPGLLADRIERLMGSRCRTAGGAKGRFTVGSKESSARTIDAFWYYQLVAWKKFGTATMLLVPANKRWADLTISHLCGTSQCCNDRHIILEPKWMNDMRTHHHETLNGVLRNPSISTEEAIQTVTQVLKHGGCRCGQACYREDLSGRGVWFSNPGLGNKMPDGVQVVPLYLLK